MFYSAAALYGAMALPAAVLAMTGRLPLPALGDPAGHAHEMLFGFALAVVAGNQLGPARSAYNASLLALWALARIAFLSAPDSPAAAALNGLFAAALALRIAPRLALAAKKWRNLALPAVLVALCLAAIGAAAARYAGRRDWLHALLFEAAILFALLMLFMGGRIIPPAIAGQLYRQGGNLDARVQPRLEGALIVACAAAAGALAVPQARPVAAAAAALAGVLAAVRLARWRLWRMRGRPDLVCLAAGYAWLALGLLALGAALAADRHVSAAIHLITVGAIGTLTLNVMALTRTIAARRDPAKAREIAWGTALLAAAVICRVLGAFAPGPWLLAAAFFWTGAFALLLGVFWRLRSYSEPRRPG